MPSFFHSPTRLKFLSRMINWSSAWDVFFPSTQKVKLHLWRGCQDCSTEREENTLTIISQPLDNLCLHLISNIHSIDTAFALTGSKLILFLFVSLSEALQQPFTVWVFFLGGGPYLSHCSAFHRTPFVLICWSTKTSTGLLFVNFFSVCLLALCLIFC